MSKGHHKFDASIIVKFDWQGTHPVVLLTLLLLVIALLIIVVKYIRLDHLQSYIGPCLNLFISLLFKAL